MIMKKMSPNFLILFFFILIINSLTIANAPAGWFDKNKIKVSKCYHPEKFKSYKEQKKNTIDYDWRAEINLKENTVVMSFTNQSGQVTLWKAKIDVKNDRFVGTYPDRYGNVFLFDLKRDAVTSRGGGTKDTVRKCKFS